MSSKNIMTIGQLREAISHLSDNDIVVMETTNLETGDAIDLFPFYIDVIDGINLTDGTQVSEVRFCQLPNKTEETQLDLLNEMIAKAGVNVVNCGNCGSVFLHRVNNIELCCPDCKYKSEPCDFPDLIY